MRGGAFFNGKEGRVDFRKNLRFKGGLVGFRKTLKVQESTCSFSKVQEITFIFSKAFFKPYFLKK
mgnify:CR=1 FL=1